MFNSLKKMFQGGEKEREKILAPVEGKAVPLSEVSDPTFSQEILGKGVAIIPEKGRVCLLYTSDHFCRRTHRQSGFEDDEGDFGTDEEDRPGTEPDAGHGHS